MGGTKWLICALLVFLTFQYVQGWTGNYYHVRDDAYSVSRSVCRFQFIFCWSWGTVTDRYYTPVYGCCPGWAHSGNQDCNIPTCNPVCQNGGNCVAATNPNCNKGQGYCSCNINQCSCPIGYGGVSCAGTTCSHLVPCYPGDCIGTNGCQCKDGFKSTASQQEYCLSLDYSTPNVKLEIYKMQVRMSYWPRGQFPPTEKYRMLTDSTHLEDNQLDFLWTNQKDFNRLETTCSSQFFTVNLPARPAYIGKTVLGVVSAVAEVYLSKRPHYPSTTRFYSLNETVPCPTPVTASNPQPGLYECNITNPNFDRLLEHGDFLKVTYKTKAGGFREVLDLNYPPGRFYSNQSFSGPEKNKSVEFRFDFLPPYHCAETSSCKLADVILDVPEITKTSPLNIYWTGWRDDDSGVYRYAMEVFKMTKTADGGLEIKPSEALNPLINREAFQFNLTSQQYTPPEPGMYSVILEAADLANNTKYARRLFLYDPTSDISTDPDHGFYVSSASQAANYTYQNNSRADIVVTWDKHFRNAFHEENFFLGPVRLYPPSLEDHKKDIPFNTPLEDREGRVTVNGIPNARAILEFQVAYEVDHDGGAQQPAEPTGGWRDMFLNTTFTISRNTSEGDTVTFWVRATDAMGNKKVERTKVTFDSTPPVVQSPTFRMNVPVPGIDFSSKFEITANDDHSGIAFIVWTFTRHNGFVLYQEKVPGNRASKQECTDSFTKCRCSPTDDCFWFDQSYSVSNCHMMVQKENLATEVITVTADVTNMAGVVTRKSMQQGNLTRLNGTEAYFPPQNVKVITITDTGVTLTWDFPPSCFRRTELWVIVNDKKLAVHKDSTQFDLSGLDPETTYTIYMQTTYEGGEKSDQQPLTFTTPAGTKTSAGAIVGIVIGVLLLVALIAFILIFVLWRKGVILQKPGRANRHLTRVSMAFDNVRRMTQKRTPTAAHTNRAYAVEEGPDALYVYGENTFNTRRAGQLESSSITLLDLVTEGRFANIYRATWRHEGGKDTVAVKMPKPGFTEDDAQKMTDKINFFATKLENHDNVIRFWGAVTDNTAWGPVIVMEYCDNGQMDKWLATRQDKVAEQMIDNLNLFSLGVAKGMEYLAARGITHRRLAARNVLLTASLDVRVVGFGPQSALDDGTAMVKTREKVPAKWAAPEVLRNELPTEKSDVWSYGVVLWEIFSMGLPPYPTIHSNEVGAQLKGGYRMDKPELAEKLHYDLMKECWQYKPAKRPTFKTIHARLKQHFSPGNRQSVDFYYGTEQLAMGEHPY